MSVSRGNIHKSDSYRVLVTETLPVEVPIIFSNDGFYTNVKRLADCSQDTRLLVDTILDSSNRSYSIPYRYRIVKDEHSTRRLSLLHPRSQIEACEFYKRYEDAICYYNTKSPASIRAPSKVGSSFFFPSPFDTKNKYKGSPVDTVEFESRIRNPASYFSYRGYNRFYKFFESERFRRLEKKYSKMWFADISKCFDSIYTHTIGWAVKTMPLSKSSIGSQSFGADFDRLMQRHNYNETNGICIGPELSRIFAETILQEIDCIAERNLSSTKLKRHRHYECVRYVDDIIIFAKNDAVCMAVYSAYEEALGRFNLHLNERKLEKHERPFYTGKSQQIFRLEKSFGELENSLLEKREFDGKAYQLPIFIRRPSALLKGYLKDVKSICQESGVGYSMASNYLISCLANFSERVILSYGDAPVDQEVYKERYIRLISLVLEASFFLYTVNPSVGASFKIARTIVISLEFLKSICPDRSVFISELLTQWTQELEASLDSGNTNEVRSTIPIELLNIFLAVSDSAGFEGFGAEYLRRAAFKDEKLDYFSLMTFLFLAEGSPTYAHDRNRVGQMLINHFKNGSDIKNHAKDAHLFLDVAACPHLTLEVREKIIQASMASLGLGQVSLSRCRAIAKEMEQSHWFTNWNKVDLLSMIRRKELSVVYP